MQNIYPFQGSSRDAQEGHDLCPVWMPLMEEKTNVQADLKQKPISISCVTTPWVTYGSMNFRSKNLIPQSHEGDSKAMDKEAHMGPSTECVPWNNQGTQGQTTCKSQFSVLLLFFIFFSSCFRPIRIFVWLWGGSLIPFPSCFLKEILSLSHSHMQTGLL